MIPRLVILGTASAVPDADHENTHMVLLGEHSTILIDCTGRPPVRLQQAGIGIGQVTDAILTHFHPDHMGGLPGLLMSAWQMGRTAPLRVYGLHHCLQRFENLMAAFQWEEWEAFFPVAFHHLPEREGILVLDNHDFYITASPVRHYVPTIGLRVVAKATGFVLAYSSDTVPCPEVVRLAQGVDLLIHEATGDEPLGHSSAAQAGAIAQEAGAKKLGLIHYNVWQVGDIHLTRLVDEAQDAYDGPIMVCKDLQVIDLKL